MYTSVDPAPPTSGLLSGKPNPTGVSLDDVQTLRTALLDTKLPLFERYRAMFALRNVGMLEAVDALAVDFSDDSALFKHEIAFVFGQLAEGGKCLGKNTIIYLWGEVANEDMIMTGSVLLGRSALISPVDTDLSAEYLSSVYPSRVWIAVSAACISMYDASLSGRKRRKC